MYACSPIDGIAKKRKDIEKCPSTEADHWKLMIQNNQREHSQLWNVFRVVCCHVLHHKCALQSPFLSYQRQNYHHHAQEQQWTPLTTLTPWKSLWTLRQHYSLWSQSHLGADWISWLQVARWNGFPLGSWMSGGNSDPTHKYAWNNWCWLANMLHRFLNFSFETLKFLCLLSNRRVLMEKIMMRGSQWNIRKTPSHHWGNLQSDVWEYQFDFHCSWVTQFGTCIPINIYGLASLWAITLPSASEGAGSYGMISL